MANINVDGEAQTVTVNEAAVKKVTVNNHIYILPAEVGNYIESLVNEIEQLQNTKTASDKLLDKRINKRVGRIVNALARAKMLVYPLDKETPLPSKVEIDSGRNTFQDDVTRVIRDALQTGADLRDDLFNPVNPD